MQRAHVLDRLAGPDWPDLSTAAAVAAFEATPFAERIAAQSTYAALQLGAAQAPGSPAIHFLRDSDPDDTPSTLSHAGFLARVTQAANMFASLGVGPGDAVSTLLPLVPQSFVGLFGAEAAGIANPVNPLLEPSQLVEILRAARTKVLVALGPAPGSDIWDKVQRIRGELPELAAIVAVNAPPDAGAGVFDFDALADAQPGDRLASGRRIAATDVAAYFHTGGTTGTPKLVRHTHANQVYQAWAVGLMLKARPGKSLLFGLPLFHVGGALTQGLATLATGGTLVVLSPAGWRNPASVRNVWRLVERYRPETLGGVPTVLAAALAVPRGDADLASLQRVSGGGSAIPVAVARTYVDQLHLPVHEVYGMTETSSVHTISYVGHPVPYSRVRIVKIGADGSCAGDCATDEIGVVAMAGPGVFSGYLSESHDRGAFVEPGWVNSGDLGRLDADGYLWITGRAKDVVIRGGHNIDPQPIEEILFQHPAVALAAVVGQPDAYAGELPVAFVQLKPGATADADALLEFVRERTPERAAVPVALHFVAPMPLTGVGKVFKPALRWDAARRIVSSMLGDLQQDGARIDVRVVAHAAHGSLVTVAIGGVAEAAARERLAARVHERLAPLAMTHEVSWT
jgi:fatty-acyl-CoA synthase